MKVNVLHIVLIFLINLEVSSQTVPYDFETEYPITMSMTPLIGKSGKEAESNKFEMASIGNEYNFNFLTHAIKNFSYGLALRLEDGLPLNSDMTFLKEVSFFDVCWNYEYEKFNFSVSISNILNFGDSVIEFEPSLERASLVAEEVYFNQEATSMIQLSVQYRF